MESSLRDESELHADDESELHGKESASHDGSVTCDDRAEAEKLDARYGHHLGFEKISLDGPQQAPTKEDDSDRYAQPLSPEMLALAQTHLRAMLFEHWMQHRSPNGDRFLQTSAAPSGGLAPIKIPADSTIFTPNSLRGGKHADQGAAPSSKVSRNKIPSSYGVRERKHDEHPVKRQLVEDKDLFRGRDRESFQKKWVHKKLHGRCVTLTDQQLARLGNTEFKQQFDLLERLLQRPTTYVGPLYRDEYEEAPKDSETVAGTPVSKSASSSLGLQAESTPAGQDAAPQREAGASSSASRTEPQVVTDVTVTRNVSLIAAEANMSSKAEVASGAETRTATGVVQGPPAVKGKKKAQELKELEQEELDMLYGLDTDFTEPKQKEGAEQVHAQDTHADRDVACTLQETTSIHTDAGMDSKVPVGPDGKLTSIGSIGHEIGECSPCLLLSTSSGCPCGIKCEFCHFPHTKPIKKRGTSTRPKKTKSKSAQLRMDKPKQVHHPETSWQPQVPSSIGSHTIRAPVSVATSVTKQQHMSSTVIELGQQQKQSSSFFPGSTSQGYDACHWWPEQYRSRSSGIQPPAWAPPDEWSAASAAAWQIAAYRGTQQAAYREATQAAYRGGQQAAYVEATQAAYREGQQAAYREARHAAYREGQQVAYGGTQSVAGSSNTFPQDQW